MKKPKQLPVKKVTNNFAPMPTKQLADHKAPPTPAAKKHVAPKKKSAPKKDKEPSMAEYAAANPHKR